MKIGDIVTLKLETDASNTYRVVGFLLDTQEVLLEHPAIPGVCLRRNKDSLNQVQATLKNSIEKCLDFINVSRKYLGYNEGIQADALILYHTIHKSFSPKQKQEVAALCGIIANIYCQHDIQTAMLVVRENEGLLDDFNFLWYSNLRGFFEGKERVISKSQRNSIFNITGFVLAQSQDT